MSTSYHEEEAIGRAPRAARAPTAPGRAPVHALVLGALLLLSFARVAAADPPMLLLDDATSAVDSRIEAELQSALRLPRAGRTTIAVAHRFSTIADADEILVLHHGVVAERGPTGTW